MKLYQTRSWLAPAITLAALVLWPATADAQAERFSRGQNVVPVYEGWEQNKDGTYSMYFGYLNRNYEEVFDVPVGPNNSFSPGPVDQGQPAHFYPRRNPFLLRVVVPADWGEKELVWTITHRGKTETARGKLMPVWVIGEAVLRGNRGRGEVGDVGKEYEVENEPPVITVDGGAQRTIGLAESVTLSANITDDGKQPEPPWLKNRQLRRNQEGDQPTNLPVRPRGLGRPAGGPPSAQQNPQPVVQPPPGDKRPGVTWTLHRRSGSGDVIFSEMRPEVKGGKASVTARFTEPGTYVLRAYADDGVRLTPSDVTVRVTPGTSRD